MKILDPEGPKRKIFMYNTIWVLKSRILEI